MHKLLFTAALLPLLFVSCSGGKGSSSDAPDTLSLVGEMLIPYDSLRQPEGIYTVGDRLYLINASSVDTLIDIFTTDGHFVDRQLRRGQGPGEVALVYSSVFDQHNKRLILTTQIGKVVALEGMGTDRIALQPLIDLTEKVSATNDSFPHLGFQLLPMADGTVIATNHSRNGVFAHLNNDGSLVGYAGEYLPLSDFGDGIPDYLVFNFLQPDCAISGDGKHFLATIGRADMIIFGEVDGDSVKTKVDYAAPPKGIAVELHENYSSFRYSPDYTLNYIGLPATSDNYAYVNHVGLTAEDYGNRMKAMVEGEIPAETEFRVYDFDGNLKHVVKLDCVARMIAVAADDSVIYALTEDDENGIYVKRYEM
ncbi:MAG: hypothetical protein NC131_18890 [Roseburia sp.]|nr:hypothetical protein [Roseburia sp.]